MQRRAHSQKLIPIFLKLGHWLAKIVRITDTRFSRRRSTLHVLCDVLLGKNVCNGELKRSNTSKAARRAASSVPVREHPQFLPRAAPLGVKGVSWNGVTHQRARCCCFSVAILRTRRWWAVTVAATLRLPLTARTAAAEEMCSKTIFKSGNREWI